MKKKLRIVMAQINCLVGDIPGNLEKHIHAANTARDELGADLIVFPELSLTGYPPEDLLLHSAFIAEAHTALQTFCQTIIGIHCLIGHPHADGTGLYNACSLIHNGSILQCYTKQCLPNYGVFDELRYFIPGTSTCVTPINQLPIGIIICEDVWKLEPMRHAVHQGAQLMIVPNASPFEIHKHEQRVAVLAKRAKRHRIPLIYVNMVGGQDELIFDGGSMVINAQGKVSQFAGVFNETLWPVDVDIGTTPIQIETKKVTLPTLNEKIYQALVLSVRDYINKNHFPGVLIGLSGGIDSALTLAIAVDALGKERVHTVIMPSRYTANMSIEDALLIAENLAVKVDTISIEPIYQNLLQLLTPHFAGKKPDLTEENLQARCRAIILMALSNKLGHLVLTTGNRSEMAVGYCTLYGDMVGGFAVLKDVPKTLVYELANYRNQLRADIPQRIIDRPPTAELAPDQKDEDSLPPYSLLDKIIDAYFNQGKSIPEMIAAGMDGAIVNKMVGLIRKNEYKRRQAAVGPHINHTSFGKDWRYPITNGFKG